MAIPAKNNGTSRELIPANNYLARCIRVIHIGEVKETINGTTKILDKVRIGWELPTLKKVFREGEPEKPFVIEEEYTLSTHEKSSLSKMLESWRGKAFTQQEREMFDVETILNAPCMLNVIHKPSKDGTKVYEKISGVTRVPDGFDVPKMINDPLIINYTNWNQAKFDTLPDFIKDKMKSSRQYIAMTQPENVETHQEEFSSDHSADDLPF